MAAEKTGIRARLVSETKTMMFLFGYLAWLFVAFTTYRRLILAEYEISYFEYGASLIEALLLAKVITIGRFLRIGERFRNRALIVPTVYKALCFGVFAIAFFVLEHVLDGWWHGKTTALILDEMIAQSAWEIMARVLVLFVALVPLFAVWETGRALGQADLFDLFFRRNAGGKLDLSHRVDTRPSSAA